MEKKKMMGDLSKKSLPELYELLTRQNNLLCKRIFIANLPDKGEKIVKVKLQIEEEILLREKAEMTCPLDSLMHQTVTETLEWTGAAAGSTEPIDSSDSADEKDPLKIFISHASAGNYKKQYRITEPEKSLIKPEDLIDDSPIEPYANRLCEKDETVPKPTKESFKPYRTVIHHESPDKKTLKVHDWDENTAATPPHYMHADAKTISLGESLDLLKVQALRLKEIKEKQAADRLCRQIESLCLKEQQVEESTAMNIVGDEQEELEMAEQEAEEEAEGGGVNYTISDVDDSSI